MVLHMNPEKTYIMRTILVEDSLKRGKDLVFWCPGCNETHYIPVTGNREPHRPVWEFNGDLEQPTLSPSILRKTGPFPDGHTHVCHSFIRNGSIEFLGDCSHDKKNTTIPLPDLPPNRDYNY